MVLLPIIWKEETAFGLNKLKLMEIFTRTKKIDTL